MSRSVGRTTSPYGRTRSLDSASSTPVASAWEVPCSIRTEFRFCRESAAKGIRQWRTARTTSSFGQARRASAARASIRLGRFSTRAAFRSLKATFSIGSRRLPRTALTSWSFGASGISSRARSPPLESPPMAQSSIRLAFRSPRRGTSTFLPSHGTGLTTSSSGRSRTAGTTRSTALGSHPTESCSIRAGSRLRPGRTPRSRSTASTTWWPGPAITCGLLASAKTVTSSTRAAFRFLDPRFRCCLPTFRSAPRITSWSGSDQVTPGTSGAHA